MIFSNEQLTKLTICTTSICKVLAEALLKVYTEKPVDTEKEIETEASGIDWDEIENLPPFDPQPGLIDWQLEDRQRREQAMNRLCGRWTKGNNRCGIEITRAGEHFTLTYLKRDGRTTDERYVLVWLDGDILYYGYGK